MIPTKRALAVALAAVIALSAAGPGVVAAIDAPGELDDGEKIDGDTYLDYGEDGGEPNSILPGDEYIAFFLGSPADDELNGDTAEIEVSSNSVENEYDVELKEQPGIDFTDSDNDGTVDGDNPVLWAEIPDEVFDDFDGDFETGEVDVHVDYESALDFVHQIIATPVDGHQTVDIDSETDTELEIGAAADGVTMAEDIENHGGDFDEWVDTIHVSIYDADGEVEIVELDPDERADPVFTDVAINASDHDGDELDVVLSYITEDGHHTDDGFMGQFSASVTDDGGDDPLGGGIDVGDGIDDIDDPMLIGGLLAVVGVLAVLIRA